ncbi:MAG: cytochrome c [Pseudomonadota bacterium]
MTMRWARIILPVLLIAGLSACGKPAEDTRPGQPVKTRQLAFKEMLKVFEPMGTMLRTNSYDADRFLGLAEQLVARRDAPWQHFAADTHYPPTKAKPEVWAKPEAFERERQAFLAATDELVAKAQSRDVEIASKAYFKVYDLCQSCHREFKEK